MMGYRISTGISTNTGPGTPVGREQASCPKMTTTEEKEDAGDVGIRI
jgi:hypothetical protein